MAQRHSEGEAAPAGSVRGLLNMGEPPRDAGILGQSRSWVTARLDRDGLRVQVHAAVEYGDPRVELMAGEPDDPSTPDEDVVGRRHAVQSVVLADDAEGMDALRDALEALLVKHSPRAMRRAQVAGFRAAMVAQAMGEDIGLSDTEEEG